MKKLLSLLGIFLVIGSSYSNELTLDNNQLSSSSYSHALSGASYAWDGVKSVSNFAVEHSTASLILTLASLATVAEGGVVTASLCAACITGCCAALGVIEGPVCVLHCVAGPCVTICASSVNPFI